MNNDNKKNPNTFSTNNVQSANQMQKSTTNQNSFRESNSSFSPSLSKLSPNDVPMTENNDHTTKSNHTESDKIQTDENVSPSLNTTFSSSQSVPSTREKIKFKLKSFNKTNFAFKKPHVFSNLFSHTNSTTTAAASLHCSTTNLPSKTLPPPLPGLLNMGNTCYLNSTLQILLYCPEFKSNLSIFFKEKLCPLIFFLMHRGLVSFDQQQKQQIQKHIKTFPVNLPSQLLTTTNDILSPLLQKKLHLLSFGFLVAQLVELFDEIEQTILFNIRRHQSLANVQNTTKNFDGDKQNELCSPSVMKERDIQETHSEHNLQNFATNQQRNDEQNEMNVNTSLSKQICYKDPTPFLRVLGTLDRRFSINGQQQDVQEFLRYLLSCIDDCEKDYSKLIFEISQMQPSHSFNDTLSGDSSTCDQKPPPIQNKKRKLDDIQTEVVNSDSCVSFDTTSTEEKDKTNLPSSKRVRNNESQSNQLSNITHNNMQSTVKFEYFRPTENTINVLTSSKVESFVERLFQGQSINSIKCLECENVSQRTETFLDLSLTIAKNRNLEWSISQFFTSERFRGDNKYHCEHCRTLTEAIRETKFGMLPKILTIHLKRFHHYSGTNFFSKVTHHIQCPFVLDVSKWCDKSCAQQSTHYELFGIIFHQGVAASFGHYFSFVKINLPDMKSQTSSEQTASSQQAIQPTQREVSSQESRSHHRSSSVWVCFDDEDVEIWSEEDVAKLMEPNLMSSKTAYILFYRRLGDLQSDSIPVVDWKINTVQQQNNFTNTATQMTNENENTSTNSSSCLSPVNEGTCIVETGYKLVEY